MRAWHKSLIPKLCRIHLIATWRETLGMYSIIINNKKGYSRHPATQEYINCPDKLWDYLHLLREEMLRRGYKPKELPPKPPATSNEPKEWQTLEEQIERLKEKRQTILICRCDI